jgi:hypothetical protein
MRTARSRTSGENFFVLFMAPSSQRSEPPQNPGRFTTGAQLPLPEGDSIFEWESFLACGKLAFARNHPLVMVNKGEEGAEASEGFLVCRRCGKTSLDGTLPGAHRRDYRIQPRRGGARPSNSCNGQFERVYLGYSFNSDVLLFRVPIQRPLRFDPLVKRDRQPLADALLSLCEALVLAVGRELDIDIREVNAGYRFGKQGEEHFADIFMYDTLSGGAGYATQAGQVFASIFGKVEDLLSSCDCTSSCDKCLRHYGNRFHHGALDRFLALDIYHYIKDGVSPPPFDRMNQQQQLEPLAQLLSLAGWQLIRDNVAPFSAIKANRAVDLWCYPSLVDPTKLAFAGSAAAKAYSPYELCKDLPGAFAELA